MIVLKKRKGSLAIIVLAFSGGFFVIQSDLCIVLATRAPDKQSDIKKQTRIMVRKAFLEFKNYYQTMIRLMLN